MRLKSLSFSSSWRFVGCPAVQSRDPREYGGGSPNIAHDCTWGPFGSAYRSHHVTVKLPQLV